MTCQGRRLRSAAKNYDAVTVVVDPADYDGILGLARRDLGELIVDLLDRRDRGLGVGRPSVSSHRHRTEAEERNDGHDGGADIHHNDSSGCPPPSRCAHTSHTQRRQRRRRRIDIRQSASRLARRPQRYWRWR